MDEFLKSLLKEGNKNNSLAVNEILGKNTEKSSLHDVSLIQSMVKVVKDVKKSEAPPLSLDEILILVEQTICSLGQTSNLVLCHRRNNILLMCAFLSKLKSMLKNMLSRVDTN